MSNENGVHLSAPLVEAILEGSLVEARLLIALTKYQADREIDNDEPINLSLTQLSKRCCMHRQSVVRAINQAEQKGLIEVDRDANGNSYYLTIPS
ncbi:MAG: MarR family transcriptional regulator [Kosmotogaceae bacterium]